MARAARSRAVPSRSRTPWARGISPRRCIRASASWSAAPASCWPGRGGRRRASPAPRTERAVRALVAWCGRRRGAVAVLALVLLGLGVWDASRVPLDVFPDFVPVQVEVQTEAPGLSPEQVEQLVTRPIEAAVNGAPDLAAMRSESIPGLSVISLNFTDGADAYRARQGIAGRVAEVASALPAGTGTPTLSPLVSSTMDLLKIGLVSSKLDPYSLRDRAQWELKPQLLAVPGVARVTVFGGAVRQIQIQPDLNKLAAFGLTLT